MPGKQTIFISHISDEGELARILKRRLLRDFSDLEVFASSDEVSIEPGKKWLDAIMAALEAASFELILCSKASITRPWINFEAGAGWQKNVPIVPICHSGLRLTDLPMPLATLQGVEASQPSSLKGMYIMLAQALKRDLPSVNYSRLAKAIMNFEKDYRPRLEAIVGGKDARTAIAKVHMYKALNEKGYKARGLMKLAVKGGVSVSEARDILRSDPNIEFDWDNIIGVIVKLRQS